MRKTGKQLLAFALVLALLPGLGTLTAFAETGEVVTDEGSGSLGEPVEWGGRSYVDWDGQTEGPVEALRLVAREAGINAEIGHVLAHSNEFASVDAVGVHIVADGAPVTLTAESISAEVRTGISQSLVIEASNGAAVTAEVDKLVTDPHEGSRALSVDNQGGTVTVIVHRPKKDTSAAYAVEGGGDTALILDGDDLPPGTIRLGEGVTPENWELTVWRGEPDINLSDSDGWYSVTDDVPIQRVNYIVRVEESAGGSLSVEGARESHGYLTARRDEELTVTAVPEEGWQVDGVQNGDETLARNESGQYTLTMPENGGVALRGLFSEITVPGGWPPPIDDPAEAASNAMTRVCFQSEGAEALERWFFPGQSITMPDAPERAGFRFVCWRTELNGETVDLNPGESFRLCGWQDFTAVWEQA